MIEQLPDENILLLQHLSFMLYIISQNAEQNKMNPRNLAVCMAPNLLQIDQVEAVEKVSNFPRALLGLFFFLVKHSLGGDAVWPHGEVFEHETKQIILHVIIPLYFQHVAS